MFKAGDLVVFKNEGMHKLCPGIYPPKDTVGEIIKDQNHLLDILLVQWPEGSTSLDDRWHCMLGDVVEMEE